MEEGGGEGGSLIVSTGSLQRFCFALEGVLLARLSLGRGWGEES